MPTSYQPALDLAKKRREDFAEALRLLLGEYFDDRRERLGAIRRLIETIWWIQDDSDESEEPLRVANGGLAFTHAALRCLSTRYFCSS